MWKRIYILRRSFSIVVSKLGPATWMYRPDDRAQHFIDFGQLVLYLTDAHRLRGAKDNPSSLH